MVHPSLLLPSFGKLSHGEILKSSMSGSEFAPLPYICKQRTVKECVVLLLFYVQGKYLRLCRDGQLT